MWQKARQIEIRKKGDPIRRGKIGATFWVNGPPRLSLFSGEPIFETNVILENGHEADVKAAIVELLPEFAEMVELIHWRDLMARGTIIDDIGVD